MTDELVGQVFDGRYRVDAPLASGGMATVYRGTQLNVDRPVAIKVLRPDDSGEHDLVERFRSEAKIISDLRHPNTLKLIDYGTADGCLYIVTELLSGRPLSDIIKEEAPLDPRRVLRIVRDVCLSLAEAHDRGIVHRDLKPANIFIEHVGAQDVVKVLDFGVAKVAPSEAVAPQADDATPRTLAGVILGTPSYLSPEQAFGRPVDGRADLYSLGVVAFECLAGRLPFEGEAIAQIAAHGLEDPPRPSRVGHSPKLPSKIEALVLRLLAKEPDSRAPSAMALAKEVDGLLVDPHLDRAPLNPLVWIVPFAIVLATISALVILSDPTPPIPIEVPKPIDASVTIDAVATSAPERPTTATVSSAVIPPDGGVRTGVRVLDQSVLAGFDEEQFDAVTRRIEPTLSDCHEGTQRDTNEGRELTVEFVYARDGNSLSVEPTDEAAERFRRCVALRLPAALIEGVWGRARIVVGDR